jgi:hypothetical protein
MMLVLPRIEDRFAGRAPPSLPLQQVEAAPHGRGRGSVAFSRCERTQPNWSRCEMIRVRQLSASGLDDLAEGGDEANR